MSMGKYRVHEVAKDFGMGSKVITQILTDYATTPKNQITREKLSCRDLGHRDLLPATAHKAQGQKYD